RRRRSRRAGGPDGEGPRRGLPPRALPGPRGRDLRARVRGGRRRRLLTVAFLTDHPALREFLISLALLAAAYLAARFASYLIGVAIERSARGGIDQRLLSALKRPITYAPLLFGAWAAVNRMPVSARVDTLVDRVIFAFGVRS